MTDVQALIDDLLPREGGYTNDPNDKGGETIWGITVGAARAYGYQDAMKDMPIETARSIYEERYWTQPRLDAMDSVDSPVACKCFDIGVNMGTSTAVKYVQRALNVLNDGGRSWPDLSVDGGFGKISQYAMATFIAQRGDEGRKVLLNMVRSMQTMRYIELAENDASQERFEFGWQRARSLI